MSYFEYFTKEIKSNIGTTSAPAIHQENESVIASCKQMCPEEERQMRIKEKLVHPLEKVGGTLKLVKSYSRPAADSNMVKPHLLRPYTVLKETLDYLLLNVTKRNEINSTAIYDFVNDRLRALRQDMTIQRLSANQCAELLAPMVRFYVYYGFKLSDCPIKYFDPVLNKKHLLECIKWFLSSIDKSKKVITKEKIEKIPSINNIIEDLSGITIEKEENGDRISMERLYILCNLDDINPIYRFLKLPKDIRSNPDLQLAYKIAVANLRNNFIEVTKLSRELNKIDYCAFCTYLPTLQRKALTILSHAFNSKQLSLPCRVIKDWLQFDSEQQVIEVCTHYGLKVDGNKVFFSKAGFKGDETLIKIKRLSDSRLNEKITDYFY